MGSCLIFSNTVIAGLILRQMYEMLRHPVPEARNIIIRKRTIATMTRGTKCLHTILQYMHTFLMIARLFLDKINKNILGGLMPPYLPLSTAKINRMADVPNATAPRAWSADFHDLLRSAYCNNDQWSYFLYCTVHTMACFDNSRA